MDPALRTWLERRANGQTPPIVAGHLATLWQARQVGRECLARLRLILARVREMEIRAAVLRDQFRREDGHGG
jgi:hypothetical protein